MRKAGIPEEVVQALQTEALAYAAELEPPPPSAGGGTP